MRLLSIPAIAAMALMLASCEGRPTLSCDPGKLCIHAGNTAEPISMDPPKTTGTWEDAIMSDMFLGLLTDNAAGEPIPGIATSWSVTPDGLVWTFKLRDMTWSDGVPLTADDVVFSLRRLEDPKTTSEYAYLLYVIKNAEKVSGGKAAPETLGVRALDPHTVEITLEHPAPYLLQLLKHQITYPVPAHIVRRWGDAWTKPEHIATSGPFTLSYWRLGDRIRLVRNNRFYDAKNVCLDEVYYYPISDKTSAERRVMRGELDVNNDIQSNRIDYLRKQPTMRPYVRVAPYLGNAYLAFNTNLPKFRDKRVRLALSMAIDRDFIVNKLRRGGEKPAYGFVPPGMADYPAGAKVYWADWSFAKRQAEARKLLADAGYGPQHPLKVEITHRGLDHAIFPAIQADWKDIGVVVTLTGAESQIAYQAFRSRDFEVADVGWIADFNDALTFLGLNQSTTGAQNYGDYKNPAYDALLAQADLEPDAKKRAALLVAAERLVIDDAPITAIFYLVNKNLVNPNVTGWVDNIMDHHRMRWVCFKDAEARRHGSR